MITSHRNSTTSSARSLVRHERTMNAPLTQRTVHVRREQFHTVWDHRIAPVATIRSGECISFDLLDASCGQIKPNSTVDAIRSLDFSRVDQVNGPIFVDGAMAGDALEVEFLELRPAAWGWTAIIPGFGLLADEFTEPALRIWQLDPGLGGYVQFHDGTR